MGLGRQFGQAMTMSKRLLGLFARIHDEMDTVAAPCRFTSQCQASHQMATADFGTCISADKDTHA